MKFNATAVSYAATQDLFRELISRFDNEPSRPGLKDTPARLEKAWQEMFSGYFVTAENIAKMLTTFEEEKSDDMVIQRFIPFSSTCEHHLLPFMGHATIAYIPDGRILGLSKFSRLLDVFTKRMQNQERITVQVAEAFMEHLKPKGAACVLTAQHLCMECRGVKVAGVETTTCCLRGCFSSEPTRSEFLRFATTKG